MLEKWCKECYSYFIITTAARGGNFDE